MGSWGWVDGWEVCETHSQGRAWWAVYQHGWLIFEAYIGPDGARCSRSSRHKIPDHVLIKLPENVRSVV
jgi:hypothetical protein